MQSMGVDLVWFCVLVAIVLQSSFLTPPVGFTLFYLKGVAPPEVTTRDIYRGIIPFVGLIAGLRGDRVRLEGPGPVAAERGLLASRRRATASASRTL